jgi:hypothetical protein
VHKIGLKGFSYGEDRFTLQIPYKCEREAKYKRKYITMLKYNAYYLLQQPNQLMLYLTSGRL